MRAYSVKEIAEMLNTNPETVRRWIRDKKLDAVIESKKSGHKVYETALQEFLRTSPKYAATAKASLISTAVLSTFMVGGIIAQKFIDAEQLNKARISNTDVVLFLRAEIRSRNEAVEVKRETIERLNRQIEEEQAQIKEYEKLISNLSLDKKEETVDE